MHHTKPAAVFQGSQSIRLSTGVANHASISYPLRATSAQSDTLGPLEDCSGLCMVHIEMVAAVESFGSIHRALDGPEACALARRSTAIFGCWILLAALLLCPRRTGAITTDECDVLLVGERGSKHARFHDRAC